MAYNPNFSRDPRGNFAAHINDSFNSVVGGTDAILLEDELNELQWIQNEARASFVRKIMPTGVVDFLAGQDIPSGQNELGVSSGNASSFNKFFTRGFKVNMHGYELTVFNEGALVNLSTNDPIDYNSILLDNPPAESVLVASPGSARDDLVLLEAWFQEIGGYSGALELYGGQDSYLEANDLIDPRVANETTRRVQLQWRIRMINGVDFTTHPEGLKTRDISAWDTNGVRVTPQGPNQSSVNYDASNKTITQLHQLDPTVDVMSAGLNDVGLFIAGDGSENSKTTLGTFDGYIYATPLFKVRRRNTKPFNIDTNPNGGRGYPGSMIVSQAVSKGDVTIYVSAIDPNLQVGDIVNVWGSNATVTSINVTSNFITVDTPSYAAATGANLNIVSAKSDRPDGLFNNIVDISDIVDLRHSVVPQQDMDSLIAKNMDALMRSTLFTKSNPEYNRVYFGLQPFHDDNNTLLLAHYDGDYTGTSAGYPVVPKSAPNITIPAFGPGVAGSGSYIPNASGTGEVGILYDVALFNPAATPFTVEFFFKPGNWGGVASTSEEDRYLLSLLDQGENEVISLYRQSTNTISNDFAIDYVNASGTLTTLQLGTENMIPFINAGDWHYARLVNDPVANSLNFQLDDYTFTGSALSIETVNIKTILVGAKNGYADFTVDELRLSNVARATTPIPSTYDFLSGDRIMNGPDGHTFHFADTNVLPAGVPNNALGLPYVPLNNYDPLWLNNTLVRHYVANGLTTGWTRLENGVEDSVGESMLPDGRMEGSAEYQWVAVNETSDGSRTTFTVDVPLNAEGKILLSSGKVGALVKITNVSGSNTVVPATLNINNSTITFTLSEAPSAGDALQFVVFTGDTHVHYIPSTRGFEIHGWNDDSYTVQYLPDPTTAPSLGSVTISGGSLSGGTTYYVTYTYTTPYGETNPAPEATITLASGNNAISATAAALPGGATGVKWYLSTTSKQETYNVTSTNNVTNIVAASAAGAGALPVGSTAQYTSHTLTLTKDVTNGLVNVVNHIRVTIPGTQGSWIVPRTGYSASTPGGPAVDISSWNVTDHSGNILTLPSDDTAITFDNNLPEGAVVDVYYEYVYIPQIGDLVKMYIQHPANQGLLNGQGQVHELVNGKLLSSPQFIITTEGTGAIDSLVQDNNVYKLNRTGPAVTNLPLAPNANISTLLKSDSLEDFITVTTEFPHAMYVGNSRPNDGNPYDVPWVTVGQAVSNVRTSTTQELGTLLQITSEPNTTSEGRADFLIKNSQVNTSTLGVMSTLVRDNGRIRLSVVTTYNDEALIGVSTAWDGNGTVSNSNLYELVGRPLIVEEFRK